MYYFTQHDDEEYSMGNRAKPYILLLVLICLIIIDIALFILVITCSIGGFRKSASEFPVLTFKEAFEHCTKKRERLPHPTTRDEEEKVIAKIKKSSSASCRLTYFGYIRTGDRYDSQLVTGLSWPSLRYSPLVGENPDNSATYSLTIVDGVIDTTKTGDYENPGVDATTNEILIMTRKKGDDQYCTKHPFKCVYLYRQTEETTYDIALENAKRDLLKEKELEVICVMPYDPTQHPAGLVIDNYPVGKSVIAVAVSVKYKFEYVYDNKTTMDYESKRFAVQDPEYDCLVYDKTRDKLFTFSCEDTACAMCV